MPPCASCAWRRRDLSRAGRRLHARGPPTPRCPCPFPSPLTDVDDLVLRERPFVAIKHLPWEDVEERLDHNSESSSMIRCGRAACDARERPAPCAPVHARALRAHPPCHVLPCHVRV